MAMQQISGRGKSIAGAAFAGLGVFILHENLEAAATQLSHLLSTAPDETLGIQPRVILAGTQVLQAYAFDHQRFLQSLFQHILVILWPLLLIVAGTVLSRDVFTDDVTALPKKDCALVDFECRSFDIKVEVISDSRRRHNKCGI
jgi:hypothetical protein